MKNYLIIGLVLTLYSCLYKEKPVKKPEVNAQSVQVSMGTDYGKQLFFNVFDLEVISENDREAWDLAFETSSEGKRFRLNGSKLMSLAVSNSSEFSLVTTATGLTFINDNPNGHWDSTASNTWWEQDKVLIVNRGISKTGISLGFIKMKIVEVNENFYRMKWSTLSGNNIQELIIPKNSSKRMVHVSLSGNGSLVDVEPIQISWHLQFTSYTHIFTDGTPYLVTGALINPINTAVANAGKSFDETTYDNVLTANFSSNENAIGYDWKTYDYDQGKFVITPHCYLVRIDNNRFFKLRFLDFYTPLGEKGAPLMQWQELIP